ncbi:uncharacterized protein Nmag_0316 [Natrialba magadii ATCC 43099]|uniref:Uncharacterized protein n=1 Tax=Natrialba magadii (strain ATCC 43099 / DSM 3394 / CCM 3739 / CIP 104546 / IAM 13178 / JCM 8861 / NBRC 102185 / NCIMB 2190 / MS3) TaxID=547559 RepID=D3SX87_NATMM|nr:hypothetical protein [Natrialba magadii]ADD03907.1 uncharacterized protein Nmag_0316 [Natrialba magadii ATCC 43099]ELY33568.1 hypothetical protein C500_02010 [Natrialba magadii ATCC 43099]
MSQRVICPHCSTKTAVEITRTVLRTRERTGSLRDGYDRSATCDECEETFACKVEDPLRH